MKFIKDRIGFMSPLSTDAINASLMQETFPEICQMVK